MSQQGRGSSERNGRGQPSGIGGRTRLLFGDEVGLALFLGGLCVTWLTWQAGVFITDTFTIANTLVNVAEGHLTIERLEYSLTLGSQPGLHVVDEQLYGRNYGQVLLALPVYYGLELAAVVVDLRLLLPGVWSLLVLALVRQIGVVLGYRRIALVGGSVLATVLFFFGVATAGPFGDDLTGILALQAVSTVALAATGVLVYRTVKAHHDRRVAAAAGTGVVVATPLWFWAPIPKRHVLTGAAVAALLFVFAHSRSPWDGPGPGPGTRGLWLRALGYAVAGFVAWIHVFEGVALLVAYATADLATAPSTGRREALAIALALSLALGPFVATNVLVSGDPTQPPRLTPGFSPNSDEEVKLGPGGTVVPADETDEGSESGKEESAGDGGGTDQSSGSETGTAGTEDSGRITEVLARTVRRGEPYLGRTIGAVETAPTRLYHTYVRSGYIEFEGITRRNEGEAINLTLLESLPVLGVLLAGAVSGVGLVRSRSKRLWEDLDRAEPIAAFRVVRERVRTARTETQTAALAALVVAGFAAMYFSLLPLNSQLTVRYILPMVPALGYLVVRTTPVRRAVREQARTLVASYLGFVVLGAVLVVAGFPWLDPAVGEAMQLHALVNLGTAAVVAGLATGYTLGVHADERLLAVGIALASAATTVLVGFMQLAYFEYGSYVIPFVGTLVDRLALVS